MPTFHDPVQDAEEAHQALRALAHATRSWDDPADTYTVLGALTNGVRSLRQTLDQTAGAHLTHLTQAHDDHGDAAAGSSSAQAAAAELQLAAAALGEIEGRLSRAHQRSARIAWHEPAHPPLVPTSNSVEWDDPLELSVEPTAPHHGITPQ